MNAYDTKLDLSVAFNTFRYCSRINALEVRP